MNIRYEMQEPRPDPSKSQEVGPRATIGPEGSSLTPSEVKCRWIQGERPYQPRKG